MKLPKNLRNYKPKGTVEKITQADGTLEVIRYTETQGKMFDCYLEHVQAVVQVIPALNIFKDPKLDEIAERMKNEILFKKADRTEKELSSITSHLKKAENTSYRRRIADASDDILKEVEAYAETYRAPQQVETEAVESYI